MTILDVHAQRKADVMRNFGAAYRPVWEIPQAYHAFYADHIMAQVFALNEPSLSIERRLWSDRLDAIESGQTYARPSLMPIAGEAMTSCGYGEYSNPKNGPSRYVLDAAEAYHWLWWLDVKIRMNQP